MYLIPSSWFLGLLQRGAVIVHFDCSWRLLSFVRIAMNDARAESKKARTEIQVHTSTMQALVTLPKEDPAVENSRRLTYLRLKLSTRNNYKWSGSVILECGRRYWVLASSCQANLTAGLDHVTSFWSEFHSRFLLSPTPRIDQPT